MLKIDENGIIVHPEIIVKIFKKIEKGPMPRVYGIIVHQTGAPTRQSTFNSYENGGNGAHFLIDLDGEIFQTASVTQLTHHVGPLRSRCVAERRCTGAEVILENNKESIKLHKIEQKKKIHDRYPSNLESIGIEIVGYYDKRTDNEGQTIYIYRKLTSFQQTALKWLIRELEETLDVPLSEVFKHPTVSFKTESEADSAQW